MIDSVVQKIVDGVIAALMGMLNNFLSSWTGMLILSAVALLFIFPMARKLWRLSRYAFAGACVLLFGMVIMRPELPNARSVGGGGWVPESQRTTISPFATAPKVTVFEYQHWYNYNCDHCGKIGNFKVGPENPMRIFCFWCKLEVDLLRCNIKEFFPVMDNPTDYSKPGYPVPSFGPLTDDEATSKSAPRPKSQSEDERAHTKGS